ncbi:uncharacterized protein [Triticum aestivum]|uniref:uncharacterized protein n=1 Tax=Triticum aestivum TaxID=4565 RepID=UPI001D01D7B6|nr:uncharacterized protein LOC123124050 [Triticum aestivum]
MLVKVVQLVTGDGSYSGGTTETEKLDDLYSRDTEIVADSDVLQHSETVLEEGARKEFALESTTVAAGRKGQSVLKDNRRSSCCGCTAMIRLLQSDDNGCYVAEHTTDHNHRLTII